MFYPDGEVNQHIDFKATPWSWCSKDERPERIEWTGIGCERTGWYRTEEGALADNTVDLSKEDWRVTAQGLVLGALSLHGGEEIVAGDAMEILVNDLVKAMEQMKRFDWER